jgi:MFS transporter, DHA2 family, multidrug resistance protein
MLVAFSALFGSTVLIPQFAQTVLGYTAELAGKLLSPGGFAIILIMPLVGWLTSRVDARYLIGGGLLVSALALFHMTNLYLGIDFKTLMWWRIFQASGVAFLFVPINTLSYNEMRPEQSNQISSMVNLMRNMGGSIGISAVTTMITRHQQVHQAYLARNTFQYNPHLQQALNSITSRAESRTDAVQAMQQAYARIYASMQQQAAVLAYIDVFWIMGAVCVLAIGILFFAKKTKPGQAAIGH